SAGLAARAIAAHAGIDATLMQHRLMGEWRPGADSYRALLGAEADAVRQPSQPYPFCLAAPLEEPPDSLGAPQDFLVEWKWDGIRAQLIRRGGETFLWSRGEELLNGRFPEIEAAAARLPDGTVLDGEILAWNELGVMPFAVMQKRIGRKVLGKKTLADAPVAFLGYDLLEWQGQDWRQQPLAQRRAQLEQCVEVLAAPGRVMVSAPVVAESWAEYAALRDSARGRRVEGLMLKRLDSAYLTGRKRGAWWKWKIGALTVDTVLVYAQLGHGRRANVYSDYTLAVWNDAGVLVPVAKAYSGLTDEELMEMDRWIRAHTLEKFGPVRSVEPAQVFEIAFEGIQRSPRHKSGIALRFPRIHRWRRDKLAADAETLANMISLLEA
ncbi:MAG TPA: cisplatin damage response ATP-dependent DNA ligase, partial [Solimonas sp.]|nr:cisplatin damage response ATP-dependent DNA ligase [Solimonas sp.]